MCAVGPEYVVFFQFGVFGHAARKWRKRFEEVVDSITFDDIDGMPASVVAGAAEVITNMRQRARRS